MRRIMSLLGAVASSVAFAAVASGSAGSVQSRWVITDLGTLGGRSSTAVVLNERGQVVGNSTTKTGQTHAVLWTLRSG